MSRFHPASILASSTVDFFRRPENGNDSENLNFSRRAFLRHVIVNSASAPFLSLSLSLPLYSFVILAVSSRCSLMIANRTYVRFTIALRWTGSASNRILAEAMEIAVVRFTRQSRSFPEGRFYEIIYNREYTNACAHAFRFSIHLEFTHVASRSARLIRRRIRDGISPTLQIA